MKLKNCTKSVSIYILLSLLGISSQLTSQVIYIDEDFADWENSITLNDEGDNNSLDIESLSIAHDNEYIYLKFETNREISIQDDQDITFVVGQTDFAIIYNLGERRGAIFRPNDENLFFFHNSIGLVSLPTVTSKVFELKIKRVFVLNGFQYKLDDEVNISIQNDVTNGDAIPNEGFYSYVLNNKANSQIPPYNLNIASDTDFRIMSYNVLFDNLFESDLEEDYANIISTINADVICFQEIYDHTSQQTLNYLQNTLQAIDSNLDWFHDQMGPDNIIISKYPIVFSRRVAGNGVFVLEMDGKEVMIINIHLPCCNNDTERQEEIDEILAFLRRSKGGSENYELDAKTPIIITGDTNFVGLSEQVSSIMAGDIKNNGNFGPDVFLDEGGLIDLKPFVTGSNSLVTWRNNNGSFSPGRLDYLFYTGSTLASVNSFVFDTESLPDQELSNYNLQRDNCQNASDHYPVVSDMKFKETSSTDKISFSKNIILSPNPVESILTIESELRYSVRLINAIGMSYDYGYKRQIDVQNLPPGFYIIVLTDNRNSVVNTQKIVIQ